MSLLDVAFGCGFWMRLSHERHLGSTRESHLGSSRGSTLTDLCLFLCSPQVASASRRPRGGSSPTAETDTSAHHGWRRHGVAYGGSGRSEIGLQCSWD